MQLFLWVSVYGSVFFSLSLSLSSLCVCDHFLCYRENLKLILPCLLTLFCTISYLTPQPKPGTQWLSPKVGWTPKLGVGWLLCPGFEPVWTWLQVSLCVCNYLFVLNEEEISWTFLNVKQPFKFMYAVCVCVPTWWRQPPSCVLQGPHRKDSRWRKLKKPTQWNTHPNHNITKKQTLNR